MKDQSKNKGFIGLLILIILALAALKYFLNWDIFTAAGTSQGHSTIQYVKDIVDTIWSYIGAPLAWIWQRILWPILSLAWNNFQHFIQWGRSVYTPVTTSASI